MEKRTVALPLEERLGIIRANYAREAPLYDVTRRLVLTHRERAVEVLRLQDGDLVLDIGCGTGENIARLVHKVGREGRVIGIDYTPAMLDIAIKKVARYGFQNVDLHIADAATLSFDQLGLGTEGADAVLFADSLFLIPQYHAALERAVTLLNSGGRISILDFKLNESLPFPLSIVNTIIRARALKRGGDFMRRPWEDLQRLLPNVMIEEYLCGFRYVAYATKP